MKFDLTEKDKKTLSAIGRSDHGRDLLDIIVRMMEACASIQGIAAGADYGAEVEGRKIFLEFAADLTANLKRQARVSREKEPESFD